MYSTLDTNMKVCVFCGMEFRMMSSIHLSKHGYTKKEYKDYCKNNPSVVPPIRPKCAREGCDSYVNKMHHDSLEWVKYCSTDCSRLIKYSYDPVKVAEITKKIVQRIEDKKNLPFCAREGCPNRLTRLPRRKSTKKKRYCCTKCSQVDRRKTSKKQILLRTSTPPKCANPNCNNLVRDDTCGSWRKYCSRTCRASVQMTNQMADPDIREKCLKNLKPLKKGTKIPYNRSSELRKKEWAEGTRKLNFKKKKWEKWFEEILRQKSINYTYQFRINGKGHPYDFCLHDIKTIVELDGCFYHGCDKGCRRKKDNREKDKEQTQFAINQGYKVVRIIEHDLPDIEGSKEERVLVRKNYLEFRIKSILENA